MCKKIVILLVILAAVPFQMKAGWIRLNQSNGAASTPVVTILSDDSQSTVIKIDISGFELKDVFSDGKKYQTVDLLTDMFLSAPGQPELCYVSKVLAVPDQAGITYEVLQTDNIQIFNNIHIPPAGKSHLEGAEAPPLTELAAVYQSEDIYPREYVKTEAPSVFRDFRIARFSFFPVRYCPAKNELHVVSSITVRINYGSGEVINPKTTSKKPIAPAFGKLYRSLIFNYPQKLETDYNGEESGHDIMLCIMPDAYYSTFLPYADWREKSGTEVFITKFSDIGATSSNPTTIKNYVTDVYNTWDNPPDYVLIIGDAGVFPFKIINYDYSFPYDDYFVEIAGNDFFPEMMIGRIPNQNVNQLQIMLNKFMKYEKNPYTTSTDWFKKGVCCANNDYISQVETKRFTANVMLQDGGFISVDTLMSDGGYGGSGCTVNLTDVKNAINNGRSFLNYRGEGWYDGWVANCYDFTVSDVSTLNNGEKLTYVTSIGCGVANFNNSGGNCFGEEWLKLGTTTSPRGAVAFIGPTSNTHTTYNNKIDRGIYIGMFQEGLDTPGEALLRGKLNMYNNFGNDTMVEYHYRIFHVLGDPNSHIWKDIPLPVAVSHPDTLSVGFSQPQIIVTRPLTGIPVKNARVSITGHDLFATAVTDSLGRVTLDLTADTAGVYHLTVCGGNVVPAIDSIFVVQAGEYISPEGTPVIVDISGNLDGKVNPNENCNATFTLKNWGSQSSYNVQASLTVLDTTYVHVVTTSPVIFNNLVSGASYTGSPFQFFVSPNCPVHELISFRLHVTSNTGSWNYYFECEVKGCNLVYRYHLVDDIGSSHFNFRMDPGENVKVRVSIENTGEDQATDVKGILVCNDPYISVIDSVAIFGTINIGASAIDTNDYFFVSVAPSCPAGHVANYSLKLSTQNMNYPYHTAEGFSIAVGVPGASDFTGPDSYGYYAYGSNDTLFEQSPVYNWVDISVTGTEIPVGYGVSNLTTTVALPFVFKYYGVNYSQLRISTDGWIAFGSGTQTAQVNAPLPCIDLVNCMVAAFWDDLFATDWTESGELRYYNDLLNHRFIISWIGVGHRAWPTWPSPTETFQIILLNPAYYTTTTGDGEIIFQYEDIGNCNSNTVGIEDHNQNVGLQYVFNNVYDTTAAGLRSSFAIKFTTKTSNVVVSTEDPQPLNSIDGIEPLGQNHPNPFRSGTLIPYSIQKPGIVSMKVFNLVGKLVRTLYEGQQAAGNYTLAWDGTDEEGHRVSEGIYFYRLQTVNCIESRKMFMQK